MTKGQIEKWEAFLASLLEKQMVDSRKIAVCATAQKLPHGELGLCLLCLRGSLLTVSDTDFSQKIGELLYTVDLKKASGFKASSFIFNPYVTFQYDNETYRFANFGNAKQFVSAVESELG